MDLHLVQTLVTTSRTYRYDPLIHPQFEVRVLTLLPSRESTAPLRGRLTVETSSIQYEALSYVWGDSTTCQILHIGNEELAMSEGLYQALKRLRYPTKARDLWVDAVCINQSSNEEKKYQVQQMYKIYSNAVRVLIWLGEGDEETDEAMRLIQEKGVRQDVELVMKIFTRPWWSRIWTLQEGLAAPSNSLMMCGDKVVPWWLAHSAIIQLVVANRGLHDLPGLGAFSNINTHRHRNVTTLEDLVYASTTRSGTDPRDNIYALLGLVQVKQHVLFEPDYAKPASWAYQKATAYIIQQRRDLEFLALRARQDTNLVPSWCFDFSSKDVLRSSVSPGTRGGIFSSYFASGGQEHHFGFDHNESRGTIKVPGVIVGTVTEIFVATSKDPAPHQEQEEDLLQPTTIALIQSVKSFTGVCRRVWTDRANPYHAISKVLAGDVWRIVAGGCQRNNEELWEAISGDGAEYRTMYNIAGHRFEPSITDAPNIHTARKRIQYLARKFVNNKSFFVTDTNYAGSASKSIQSGDVICVLFGCKHPLILRPYEDDTYRIVTAAYVHDIMTGGYFYFVTERHPIERPVIHFKIR